MSCLSPLYSIMATISILGVAYLVPIASSSCPGSSPALPTPWCHPGCPLPCCPTTRAPTAPVTWCAGCLTASWSTWAALTARSSSTACALSWGGGGGAGCCPRGQPGSGGSAGGAAPDPKTPKPLAFIN